MDAIRGFRFLVLATVVASFTGCAGLGGGSGNGLSNLFSNRSADIKENSFAVQMTKARNYERSGQHEKARTAYEKIVRQFPVKPGAHHRLAVVLDKQRRHHDAQEYYTRALQLDARNPEIFNDLGYCFYLQGDMAKAESAARKAVTLEPKNTRFLNNLGMILGHGGRYDEALAVFAQAGSEADAYYNLAFVYATQEKPDLAKDCFKQCLNLDPQYHRARDVLESFEDFDALPDELRDVSAVATNGVRYVPYEQAVREAAKFDQMVEASGDVQQVQYTADSYSNSSGRPPASLPSYGQQNLNQRAQAMMQEKLNAQMSNLNGNF